MFITIDSFDTILSADSVEWCPIEPFRDVFVCGTYKLSERESIDNSESSKRLGKIYLFRVEFGRLNLLEDHRGAAILDMKWAHMRVFNRIFLGVVNSKGVLEIYELLDGFEPSLALINKINVRESEPVLALSLDWSMGNEITDHFCPLITVSASDGSINIFELCPNSLQKIKSWPGHSFEAWITAFDYFDSNVIYSGGDDCKFKSFDIRIDTPVMINKHHFSGVTSIHCNADHQFLLASGSYDEHLRLWDTRKFTRPISSVDLGGGIWRLKWNPLNSKYLLAACMYGGFRVIDCSNVEKPTIVAEYNEHESISYGCDWSHLSSLEIIQRELFPELEKHVALISTCSFYDHLLNMAIFEFPY